MNDALALTVELPRDPTVLRKIAAILAGAGAWRELVGVVDAQVALAPTDARLCARQYRVHLLAGDQDGARQSLTRFLSERGASVVRVEALGRLLGREGVADGMIVAWAGLAGVLDQQALRQPGSLPLALRRYRAHLAAGSEIAAAATIAETACASARIPGQVSRLWVALARHGLGTALVPALRALLDSPRDAEDASVMLAEAICAGGDSSAARETLLLPLLAADEGRLAKRWVEILVGDVAGGSLRRTHAWQSLLALLMERDEAALVDAALNQLARRAEGSGLAGYIASLRSVTQLNHVLASLRRDDERGQDTLALQLKVLRALEAQGHHASADRLEAELAGRIVYEDPLDEPSPTASTVMFRNPPLLEALVATIEWLSSRRTPVSVHIAACSTGEEAYSLVLALERAELLDCCELSASDVDPPLIRRARTGVIDKTAFLAVPQDLQPRFEHRRDGRYNLAPELLRRIAFSVADLLRPRDAGTVYDLLVANNVMVHFPVAVRKRMLAATTFAVAVDGVLCLGGGRHDELEQEIGELGIVPVAARSADIFDAWRIQRSAWYASPRRYWALPPARLTADSPWKHATLFARSAGTAEGLERVMATTMVHPPV